MVAVNPTRNIQCYIVEPNYCLDNFFTQRIVITRGLEGAEAPSRGSPEAETPEQKFYKAEYEIQRLSSSPGVMHSLHAKQHLVHPSVIESVMGQVSPFGVE